MLPRKLVARVLRALPILLLPVVLAPAAVIALGNADGTQRYQAEVWIWVLDPAEIQPVPLDIDNIYLSPAQRQADVVNDLLRTQSFRLAVAEAAGLIDPLGAEGGGAASATTIVADSVEARADGANLLLLIGVHEEAETARVLAQAAVAAYNDRLRMEAERQVAVELDYYQRQMVTAEEELAQRRAEAEAYAAQHPEVLDRDTYDSRYEQLTGRVDAQARLVDGLAQAMQDAQLNAVSFAQGLAARLNVVDPAATPEAPLQPTRTRKYGLPVAAAVLGMMLSGGYLLVAYYTDHSIASREDLDGLPVRYLGAVPSMQRPGWITRMRDRRGSRAYARRLAASVAQTGGAR